MGGSQIQLEPELNVASVRKSPSMLRVLVVYDRNRGLGQYFEALRSLPGNVLTYFKIGKVTRAESALAKVSRHLVASSTFICLLIRLRPSLIHLNPSLSVRSLVPVSFYLVVSKLFRCRVLMFIHGWNPSTQRLLEKHKWSRRRLLGLANAFIVLSHENRQTLKRWGVQRPIFLETTVVADDWTKDVHLEKKLAALKGTKTWTILFLAEILREKGVFLAIEATRILQMKFRNVKLIIAGDGTNLVDAQMYVRNSMMEGVTFSGYVSGTEKRNVFEQSDIFCLPTMFDEGLPIAVVEAMCFGLPVVTRAAGGLKDLFERTVFGCMTESKDAVIIAEKVEQLICDTDLYARIAWNNYMYSRNHFLASSASERLRCIYELISDSRVSDSSSHA